MSQDIIPGPGSRPSPPIAVVTRTDAGICLLADHLDAALAAGEDLLACSLTVGAPHSGMGPDDIRAEQAELRGFIDRVRALEMALVSRILQARRRAGDLPKLDDAHTMMLNLLIGGTAELSEAVREASDRVEQQFLTGSGHLAYLRSRGFIEPEAACLGPLAELQVTDAFLVYGRLPLGGLLDLVSAFLDKLDLVFDLYPEAGAVADEEDDQSPAPVAGLGALLGALREAAERDASAGDSPGTANPPLDHSDISASDTVLGDSEGSNAAVVGVANPSHDEQQPSTVAAVEANHVDVNMEVFGPERPASTLELDALVPVEIEIPSNTTPEATVTQAQPEIAGAASAEVTAKVSETPMPSGSLAAALAKVEGPAEGLADRLKDCKAEPSKPDGTA